MHHDSRKARLEVIAACRHVKWSENECDSSDKIMYHIQIDIKICVFLYRCKETTLLTYLLHGAESFLRS
jgi:hypothetical protein